MEETRGSFTVFRDPALAALEDYVQFWTPADDVDPIVDSVRVLKRSAFAELDRQRQLGWSGAPRSIRNLDPDSELRADLQDVSRRLAHGTFKHIGVPAPDSPESGGVAATAVHVDVASDEFVPPADQQPPCADRSVSPTASTAAASPHRPSTTNTVAPSGSDGSPMGAPPSQLMATAGGRAVSPTSPGPHRSGTTTFDSASEAGATRPTGFSMTLAPDDFLLPTSPAGGSSLSGTGDSNAAAAAAAAGSNPNGGGGGSGTTGGGTTDGGLPSPNNDSTTTAVGSIQLMIPHTPDGPRSRSSPSRDSSVYQQPPLPQQVVTFPSMTKADRARRVQLCKALNAMSTVAVDAVQRQWVIQRQLEAAEEELTQAQDTIDMLSEGQGGAGSPAGGSGLGAGSPRGLGAAARGSRSGMLSVPASPRNNKGSASATGTSIPGLSVSQAPQKGDGGAAGGISARSGAGDGGLGPSSALHQMFSMSRTTGLLSATATSQAPGGLLSPNAAAAGAKVQANILAASIRGINLGASIRAAAATNRNLTSASLNAHTAAAAGGNGAGANLQPSGSAPIYGDLLTPRLIQGGMALMGASIDLDATHTSIMSHVPPSGAPSAAAQPHTTKAEVTDVAWDGTSTLNQYVILGELGQGAQGKVLMAVDGGTGEMRAIKQIPRPQIHGPGVRERIDNSRQLSQLQREVAVMKKCRHRNVVALYEVIDDPDAQHMYLVMQYVEHGAVAAQAPDGTVDAIPASTLASYARQLCAGMQYLHNHGVVHRDIKPENILKGANDQVFLADFGISSLADEAGHGSSSAFDGGSPGLASAVAHAAAHEADFENSAASSSGGFAPRAPVGPAQGTYVYRAPELLESPQNTTPPTSARQQRGVAPPDGPTREGSRSTSPAANRTTPPAANNNGTPTIPFASRSPPPAIRVPGGGGSTTPSSTLPLGHPKKDDGRASDVWALGVTLYVLLYGRLPWTLRGAYDYMQRVLDEAVTYPPTTTVNGASVPILFFDEWRTLLEGMLTKDPARRWAASKAHRAAKALHMKYQDREEEHGLDDHISSDQIESAFTRLNQGSPVIQVDGQLPAQQEPLVPVSIVIDQA